MKEENVELVSKYAAEMCVKDYAVAVDKSVRENEKEIDRLAAQMAIKERATQEAETEKKQEELTRQYLSKTVETKTAMDYYEQIYKGVEKIKMGKSRLLFVRGRPGIGKTMNIGNAIMKFGIDYVPVTGNIKQYLYRLMYEHNGATFWLKEVTALLKDEQTMNLLKCACEDGDEVTVSNYKYGKTAEDLPKSFNFRGKLIFDYNSGDVPGQLREDFEALKSRGDYVDIVLSKDDIDVMMKEIAKTDSEKEVTTYLQSISSKIPYLKYNLRLQQKAFRTYEYAKEKELDWQGEILKMVQQEKTAAYSRLYGITGGKPIRTADLKRELVWAGYSGSITQASLAVKDWILTYELHIVGVPDEQAEEYYANHKNCTVCINKI